MKRFIFIVGLGGLVSCTPTSESLTYNAADQVPKVRVITAIQKEISQVTRLDGILTSKNQADLVAPFSATVIWQGAAPTDRVREGQKIFCLDSTELWWQKEKARIRYELAAYEFGSAALSFSRNGRLHLTDTVQKSLAYSTGLSLGEIEYKEAVYHLQEACINSPIDGEISEILTNTNAFVNAGEVMARVQDNSGFLVRGYALETLYSRIKPGDVVEIRNLSSEVAFGKVRTHIPEIDKDGFFQVVISMKAGPSWVSGMHVTLSIHTQPRSAISVPVEALFERGGRMVVFLYRKGKAEWSYVEPGAQLEQEIEIVQGIEPGDTVILDHQLELDHGTAVRLF